MRKVNELIVTFENAKKATDGMTFEMIQVSAESGKAVVIQARVTDATSKFAASLENVGLQSLHDFSIRLGEAVANVVLFGDSLKDTLKNLGQRAAGNLLGSVVNLGISAAFSAIPFGSLFGNLFGKVVGDQFGNVARSAARGGVGGGVGGGGGVSLSLNRLLVEQGRERVRNGNHLIGLG